MTLEDKVIIIPLTESLTIVVDGDSDIESHVKRKDIIKDFFEKKERRLVEEMDISSALNYFKNKYGEKSKIYESLRQIKRMCNYCNSYKKYSQ